MSRYTIREYRTRWPIRSDMTLKEVDAWWRSNEDAYFAVRTIDDGSKIVIEVEQHCRHRAPGHAIAQKTER